VSRQHAAPVLITADGTRASALTALPLGVDGHGFTEADIQALVQAHPTCMPIAEIDALFRDPVPICTELSTPAGPIDNFMVTPSGLPVLVECKLWRNPQARREVVGQILDYAKELSRWSSSDLQRELRKKTGISGDFVIERLRAAGHPVDEVEFNDALTANLRRGRFLLLIVGDGIREGVEAITEYLQVHAGMHFTLGLVEMPLFRVDDGSILLVPRVVARTTMIIRHVVAQPAGFAVSDGDEVAPDDNVDSMTADRVRFWSGVLKDLVLDDPEQPIPVVSRQGYVYFMLPAPSGRPWITVYRDIKDGSVGLFLSYTRNTLGEQIVRRLVDDYRAIAEELGGSVCLRQSHDRVGIQDSIVIGPLDLPANRDRAISWLRGRINDFINVLRPRVRTAAADLAMES